MATTEGRQAVGLAEAADILGMSRTNFNMHRKRYGADDQCPKPTEVLKCGPVWLGKELRALEKWSKTMEKKTAARQTATAKRAQVRENAVAKKAAAKATKATKAAAKKVATVGKQGPGVGKAAPTKATATTKAVAKKGVFGKKAAA